MEPPVQHFLGLIGPLLLRSQPVDHHDQTQTVLHRRADQAVAGLLGESGLEAVRPDIERQQGIAVELTDLVPGEFALAVIFVVLGIGLDDMPRQLREFARGHKLSGVGKPGRIAKGRFRQSKLPRALGHQLGESGFVA